MLGGVKHAELAVGYSWCQARWWTIAGDVLIGSSARRWQPQLDKVDCRGCLTAISEHGQAAAARLKELG